MNCRFPEHENIKYEFSTNKKKVRKSICEKKNEKKKNQENGSIVADVGFIVCMCF